MHPSEFTIPMRKDRGAVIAQAVRGSPTPDVRGVPTSLVGDGPSAGTARSATSALIRGEPHAVRLRG